MTMAGTAPDVFVPYGPTHWAALAVFAVGAVVLVLLGRRLRDSRTEVVFSRVFAVVFAGYVGAMLVYRWLPENFDVHVTLPIHLSDLTWMVAIHALLTRSQWSFALTYYWGLTLAPQAMLTPALDAADFPHIDFIDLWVQHILSVWAAIYLTWGRGGRVGWRDLRLTLGATVVWGVMVFAINSVLGTNYGFLNAKPNNPSILDLFGDWPWYLLTELVIGTACWALITWPWTARSPSPGELGRDPAQGR